MYRSNVGDSSHGPIDMVPLASGLSPGGLSEGADAPPVLDGSSPVATCATAISNRPARHAHNVPQKTSLFVRSDAVRNIRCERPFMASLCQLDRIMIGNMIPIRNIARECG